MSSAHRSETPTTPRDAALHIVRVLRDHGHTAYFAGGCVRDQLLGLTPKDYDVATSAPPDAVRALFPRSNAVGAAFGVVLVYTGHGSAPGGRVATEVATFRNDGNYSDGRRPDDVTFTDAKQDAQRRDFTINGLFLDPLANDNERLIDYVGGRPDLQAGILRAIGNPDQRFAEDYLRMLRAVRFAARFHFKFDPYTEQAIRKHADKLTGTARERIGDEVHRMLAGPTCKRAARAATLLASLGLDAPLFGRSLCDAATPNSLAALPENADHPTRLVAWLPTLTPKQLRRSLCLSNGQTDAIRDLRELLNAFPALLDQPIASRKRRYTHTRFSDALNIFRVASPSASQANALAEDRDHLTDDGIGLAPPPLLTGDHLVAAGHRPGPDFKTKLDAAYNAQLEGRIATQAQALQYVIETE
ncbi:MAG: CCA tRNA nucleotidyltransferase [Planctomycetota bacterium]